MSKRFAGLLLLATVAAYIPVYSAGWIWDDDWYVTDNEALRDLEGLRRIWTDTSATPQYYPLTHTSFWLQYRIWELWPAPYHALNVLLHALSAILLWRALVRLEVPGARIAALLFALHPLHVESVAWVTERKNVLCGAFFLAAALAYLSWACGERRGIARPAAAFLSYLAALFSKTVAASLPIVLFVLLVWKRRLRRVDAAILLPMLAIGAALGRLTARLEKEQVLAVGPEWDFGFLERCLIAGRALWFYLGKLLWPAKLSFVYERWSIDTGSWAQWAYPAAAIALFFALIAVSRRVSAGPLVAAVVYGVSLGPALGFFNVYPMRYSFVADHFVYLASLGPLTLLGAGLALGARRIAVRRTWLVALLVPLLAVPTFLHARTFRDEETLWRATTATTPTAWMAHHNLARLLESRGQREEAAERYRAAVDANPALVEAWIGLGTAAIDLGRHDEAIAPLQRALELSPRDRVAAYNLGVALQRSQRFAECAQVLAELVRRAPEMGPAQYNLSLCLFYSGRPEQAAVAYSAARDAGFAVDPAYGAALQEALEPRPGR